MADSPRAGPPEKRERRPAGTKAAHLEDTSISNTIDHTTGLRPVEALSADDRDLEGWGERNGIPVVPVNPPRHLERLVAAGAPAWIALIDDLRPFTGADVAFAVKHASDLIVADIADDDIARLYPVAAELAAKGPRVFLFDWPADEPIPARGGDDRCST